MTRLLPSDDDVVPHQMAGHAARVEHSEHRGGAGAVRLRIAPHLRAADLAGLGRIQPRHALEQHLVVLRREAPTPASAERVNLSLRRRGQ